MAKRSQFKMSVAERRRRSFSDSFKKKKVREIELGYTKVSEICKEYEVSKVSVYKWLKKYGTQKDKPERLIVETMSDTKKLVELRKKIAELERVIGQKQISIDFHKKMIDLAEEYYQIDIKKKFTGPPSNTSGKTGKK